MDGQAAESGNHRAQRYRAGEQSKEVLLGCAVQAEGCAICC